MNTPVSHLILYDSDCGLCDRSVQFVLRHDKARRFYFCPINSPLGTKLYAELGLDASSPGTFAAVINGKGLLRSRAAIEVAVLFGGPWRVLGLFRWVPSCLADTLYGLIAKNRHRFFKRPPSCMLDPSFRARVLR